MSVGGGDDSFRGGDGNKDGGYCCGDNGVVKGGLFVLRDGWGRQWRCWIEW